MEKGLTGKEAWAGWREQKGKNLENYNRINKNKVEKQTNKICRKHAGLY